MAKHSPVIGRYVTFEVEGAEYKVFYLRNGEGTPLVCQHSAGGHNHEWRELLEDPEITKNYDVIAFDLARHGKSDPPHNQEWWKDDYKLTKDHLVSFITAFCEALDLEDPIFMGGNVALHLALHHGDRFRAVIPVEAAEHTPGLALDWWRHPHANASQVGGTAMWDQMAPQSPDQSRWLNWHYHTQGAEVLQGDLYFQSVDHDLRDQLGDLDTRRCPVVMMTGTYDYIAPPEVVEATARQIPGCIYIEMDDIGHFPMSENYPHFAKYLTEALRLIEERT